MSNHDTMKRARRSRRKAAIDYVMAQSRDPSRATFNRIAIEAIARELQRIHDCDDRTSAEKDARFKVVLNRVQFQSPL